MNFTVTNGNVTSFQHRNLVPLLIVAVFAQLW